jgi:DNA-binding Xre family transcriptional regulator
MKNENIKSFRNHLEKLKQDADFESAFNNEKRILGLAIQMAEFRQSQNLTQTELAKRSGITQQQLSKLERGENCNITTFLKVCNTLGIEIMLRPPNFV